MSKLAKAYKMLKTCNIKSGSIHVVHEEFEAGKTYATKDIIAATSPIPDVTNKEGKVLRKGGPDDRRVRVWIEQGFCVPAEAGGEVATVATPDEKVEAKEKAEKERAEKLAEVAVAKAEKEGNKLEAANRKVQAKEAKAEAAANKKLAAEEAKEKKKADKAIAAEEALQAKDFENLMKLWEDVPVEDFPKYVAKAKADGYELEDAPGTENSVEWLAYFVAFFGESGPPDLEA